MKLVLIDMDEVIFWTYGGLTRVLKEKHPEIKSIPYEQNTEYYVEKLYSKNQRKVVNSIWYEKGFFRNLELMPGALEALTEISKKNEIFICSSPLISPYCLQEKYDAVGEKLGGRWQKKLITTKDKTIIEGDILIDDKPEITGVRTPRWEHVLYDHPWNRHVSGKRKVTWQNYREVLPELF
jgi:5'-nucleotidase